MSTSFQAAFESAGYQDPLLKLAHEAWRRWNRSDQGAERRAHVAHRLKHDLTWLLLERYAEPGVLTRAIGALLSAARTEILALPRDGGGHGQRDTHSAGVPASLSPDAARAAGAGHTTADNHPSSARATSSPDAARAAGADQECVDSHDAIVPATSSPDAGAEPAGETKTPSVNPSSSPPVDRERLEREKRAKLVNEAHWAAFTMDFDGTPLCDLTPNQARTIARCDAVRVRYVMLATAGLPPNEPIRNYLRPDEASDFLQRAKREPWKSWTP